MNGRCVYEQTSSGAVTKHYSFGGVAVAVRTGSGISLLYQDRVHSTVYTTDLAGVPMPPRLPPHNFSAKTSPAI